VWGVFDQMHDVHGFLWCPFITVDVLGGVTIYLKCFMKEANNFPKVDEPVGPDHPNSLLALTIQVAGKPELNCHCLTWLWPNIT